MLYEILTASKSDLATEEAVTAALKEAKPGFAVENITGTNDEWTIRLVADDQPDFLKKKDDDSSDDSSDESSDSDSDSDSDSSDDDSDSDSDSDSDEDGDEKGKNDANPADEVKGIINQLTTLFKEMGGKVEELQAAHDDKADKLKDIADTAGGGPEGEGDMPPGLPGPGAEDVGPVPGKPAGPPRPPMPGSKMDKRRPGVPPVPGGGLPTFTNYQVVQHPGVDEDGNKISLTAAASVLESDEEFSQYEVVGMQENADGSFSAKLKLKSLK